MTGYLLRCGPRRYFQRLLAVGETPPKAEKWQITPGFILNDAKHAALFSTPEEAASAIPEGPLGKHFWVVKVVNGRVRGTAPGWEIPAVAIEVAILETHRQNIIHTIQLLSEAETSEQEKWRRESVRLASLVYDGELRSILVKLGLSTYPK